MSTPKAVKVTIKDVQVNVNGNLVLICTPTKENPTGVYSFNQGQTARICSRVGIPNPYALKHVVGFSNGTSALQFIQEDVKTGEAWQQLKGKEVVKSGVYEKDWTKTTNHELVLGFAATTMIAQEAIKSMFAAPMQFAAPAPAAVSIPVTATIHEPNTDDNSSNTDDSGEKVTV